MLELAKASGAASRVVRGKEAPEALREEPQGSGRQEARRLGGKGRRN